MGAQRCPACNLVNPGTAATCDCGWSFASGKMTSSPQAAQHSEAEREAQRRARGNSQLAVGALLLVIGVVITAVTYSSVSTSGGTYIIAYGPMLLGAINIVRGLRILNR
jgi:hypothetical protein